MAVFIGAAFSVIDLIAVTDAKTLLGAIVPDRMLNEPRKRPGKPPVELLGVDLPGDGFDDFGAAASLVAGDAVGVVGLESVQDPGPVQEIVNECIDRDHGRRRLRATGAETVAHRETVAIAGPPRDVAAQIEPRSPGRALMGCASTWPPPL